MNDYNPEYGNGDDLLFMLAVDRYVENFADALSRGNMSMANTWAGLVLQANDWRYAQDA